MIRYIPLLSAILLLTASYSGGSDTETAQVATSAPTNTVAPPIPTTTATPIDLTRSPFSKYYSAPDTRSGAAGTAGLSLSGLGVRQWIGC
jgi:hypothetical protein